MVSSLEQTRSTSGDAVPPPRPLSEILQGLGASHELVQEWSSRTSQLYLFRSATVEPPEVVVKVCERWSPDSAQASVLSSRRLSGLCGEGKFSVIEYLAWSVSPPALVAEYVRGEEFSQTLQLPASAGDDEVADLLRGAGGFLARAHRVSIPLGTRTKSDRRMPDRPVLSVGDFAVYNLRLDARGHLVYLEPPSSLRVVSAFRDLSWFLGSLDRVLRRRRDVARSLRRSFLRGYRQSGARWTVLDEIKLGLYLLRQRLRLHR